MAERSDHEFSDMEEVGRAVDENGGVLSLHMYSLRNAYGKGKLGKLVLIGISDKLKGLGLGHYPRELPNNQNIMIRLYRFGNPVAEIIEAALDPSEESDELLRRRSEGTEAELLKQVRELVCE